ncbi:MAG TPA: response regulator [Microscillaceae bacterium]|jgi:CheY-like chemotaxis protein|nr:response regulator [Microscillaceae bacterium]
MEKVEQVIVVDDDATNNLICESVIKKIGLSDKVLSFTLAQNALLYLQEKIDTKDFPAIIFLDINMIDLDGWDFIQQYRALIDKKAMKSPAKIFMITSSIDQADQQKAANIDLVSGFIVKPFTEERVRKVLK